jgi:hypothetical protein
VTFQNTIIGSVMNVKKNTPREVARISEEIHKLENARTPGPSEFAYYNPQTIAIENLHLCKNVIKCTKYEPAFTMTVKAKIPEFTVGRGIRTGPIVKDSHGRELISYCINHRNPRSALSAMCDRHLATKSTAEPEFQEAFERLARQKEWNFDDIPILDIEEWLGSHPTWSRSKKDMYRQSWQAFVTWGTPAQKFNYDDPKNANKFTAFPKSGEENVMIKGSKVKARARNIASMHAMYNFVNYLQHVSLRRQKVQEDDFGSGRTPTELLQWVKQALTEFDDPVIIDLDHSAFDTTRFAFMINAMDVRQWYHLVHKYEQHFSDWWTPRHSQLIMTQVIEPEATLVVISNGVRILEVQIRGETNSGNGQQTTDGNTNSNRIVSDLVLELAGIRKRKRQIIGDDGTTIIERKDLKSWLQAAERVYRSKDGEEPHGIGWIAKYINVHDGSDPRFFFTSKMAYLEDGCSVFIRDPRKVVANGRYYLGSQQRFFLRPSEHKLAVRASLYSSTFFDPMFEQMRPKNITPAMEQYMWEHAASSLAGTGKGSIARAWSQFMSGAARFDRPSEYYYGIAKQLADDKAIVWVPSDFLDQIVAGRSKKFTTHEPTQNVPASTQAVRTPTGASEVLRLTRTNVGTVPARLQAKTIRTSTLLPSETNNPEESKPTNSAATAVPTQSCAAQADQQPNATEHANRRTRETIASDAEPNFDDPPVNLSVNADSTTKSPRLGGQPRQRNQQSRTQRREVAIVRTHRHRNALSPGQLHRHHELRRPRLYHLAANNAVRHMASDLHSQQLRPRAEQPSLHMGTRQQRPNNRSSIVDSDSSITRKPTGQTRLCHDRTNRLAPRAHQARDSHVCVSPGTTSLFLRRPSKPSRTPLPTNVRHSQGRRRLKPSFLVRLQRRLVRRASQTYLRGVSLVGHCRCQRRHQLHQRPHRLAHPNHLHPRRGPECAVHSDLRSKLRVRTGSERDRPRRSLHSPNRLCGKGS